MDNLTHALAGSALGAAGLRRATPLATAALVLAANAPDVDAVVYLFRDPYFALAFRRGWTHGPLAWLVLPFVVTGLLLAWDRGVRRRRRPDAAPARARPLLLLALLGVLTHPALDWLNTYGIRLLMPFSDRWFYGDALFIIDPWLWLLLGGATFLGYRPRGRGLAAWVALAVVASVPLLAVPLVPSAAKAAWVAGLAAIGAARYGLGKPFRVTDSPAPRAVRPAPPGPALAVPAARLGLGLGIVYILLMIAVDRIGARRVRAYAAERGIDPIDAVMVAPVPANPFAAEVVVATPAAYHLGTATVFGRPRVRIDAGRLPRMPDGAVVEAALRTERARNFMVWARFPVVRVDTLPDGYRVRIGDARYPDPPGGGLGGLEVRLDRELRPVGQ